MPNKQTFLIEPIAQLLRSYNVGKNWIDPFSGKFSPAEITNDINPGNPAKYHFHAKEFVENILDKTYDGCLFDPPYSTRQVKECYDGLGLSMKFEDTQGFPNTLKPLIAKKIKPDGIVITFGWQSMGFGINLGFEIQEILLVPHGGMHNDTIITVEKKIDTKQLDLISIR